MKLIAAGAAIATAAALAAPGAQPQRKSFLVAVVAKVHVSPMSR